VNKSTTLAEGEIMMLSNDDLKRAESGILELLGNANGPFPPASLMEQLKDQGISEYSARVAIWYLIDRNLIELTMDRLLTFVPRDVDKAARESIALAGD
jgi:hypothetical protein